MVSKKIVISNKLGMHMRPAQKFVKLATASGCNVEVVHKGCVIDAKSIMNLLAACIKCGDEIGVRCTGDGEAQALEVLSQLAASGFGEA